MLSVNKVRSRENLTKKWPDWRKARGEQKHLAYRGGVLRCCGDHHGARHRVALPFARCTKYLTKI